MKSEICQKCADKGCFGYDHRVTECVDFQPMTNADRVRGMTDEELAKTMHDMTLISTEIGLSTEWWLQWLKSPVEVDNG